MADWLKGATLVEDTPSWLSSATLVQDKPGAFEGLGSQIVAGIGDTIAGKGMTAKEFGATDVGQGIQNMGDLLRGQTADPSQRFTNPLPGDTTLGGYSVDAVPALVARGLGNVAGELPAGAVGRGVAAVSGAASTFGPELEARRQRNNGEVGTADYLAAGGSAAVQGALSALGLGSILKGVRAPAGGVTGAAGRVGTAAGTEAVTGAAEGVVSDVATNVGTKNSELSAKSLIDSAVTGGVQGLGTGGSARGIYEVGRAPRVVSDAIAMRSYEHKEVLPAMAAEMQQIADNNGLRIDKLSDAKKISDIYDSRLTEQKKVADQWVGAELDKQLKEGRISQEDRDTAVAALKTPNKEGFDVLLKAAGDEPNVLNAIELAKRSSMSRLARTKSGLDRSDATEVQGPLSRTKSRLIAGATTAGLGAVMPASFMSSVQGGSALAMMTSAAHVAPIVGGFLAGYTGLRALDKMLGTNNPMRQLVDASARKGVTGDLPGKGMESPRALKEAEEARRMQEQADAIKDLRISNLSLRNDNLSQQLQLRPTVVEAQNAQRQASAAKSQAQADAIPILTQAQAAQRQATAQKAQAQAEATPILAQARANEIAAKTQTAQEVGAARAAEVTQRTQDNKVLTAERLKGEQLKTAIKEIDKRIKQLRLQKAEATGSQKKAIQQQITEAKAEKTALQEGASPSEGTPPTKPRISVTAVGVFRPDDVPPNNARPEAGQSDPRSVANTSLVEAARNATKWIPNTKNRKAVREILNNVPTAASRAEADALVAQAYERFPKYAERIKAQLDAEGFNSQLDKQFRDSTTGKYTYDGPSDGKDKQYADPLYNKTAKNYQVTLQKGINKAIEPLSGFERAEAQKLLDTMKPMSGKDARYAVMDELIKNFPDQEKHFRDALVPAIEGSTKYRKQSSADNSKRRKRNESA
jgi:hypothetical protein